MSNRQTGTVNLLKDVNCFGLLNRVSGFVVFVVFIFI
ncbi:hypothetical protein ACIP1Z_18670, partial [Pseudomonas moraviensis]